MGEIFQMNSPRSLLRGEFINKGDSFYHSVYIQSKLFDHFDFDSEMQGGSLRLEQVAKAKPFNFCWKKSTCLSSKKGSHLIQYADTVIKDSAESKAFPHFNNDPEEHVKKEELESVIRKLCQVEPRVFARLNPEL